jgi:BASS family bile acid:Na+ symporter
MLAGILLVGSIVVAVRGERSLILPLLGSAMLCAALASGGFAGSKKWGFFIWLSTAVLIGMAFPTWFIGAGNFKFTSLFMPLLQLIMFGMGTTLSLGDFGRVLKMPQAVLVGVACQFTIMPLLGYALAKASGFPPEVGAGIILVGSVPSGLASTVMVYIAKADVALSVTLTAVTSLLAPIITPLLMRWLAAEMVEIDSGKLTWDLTKMTVIPVLAGLIWHHWIQERAKWISRLLPSLSVMGIIAMTLLTIAIGRDKLLQLGFILIFICLAHTTFGYLLGYLVCRMFGMKRSTCRTIAFEVGMQNSGMASAVAASLNKVATLGLAPIVFGPVMNLTASTLANWWRNRPTEQASQNPEPSLQ